MAQSSLTIGRVTADLELKTSQNMNPYVRFSLAEDVGFGESRTTQFPQVWARGENAKHLIKGNVKKGSLIWVSGPITLEEFTKRDGSPDKRLKITLENWGYTPIGKPKSIDSDPPRDEDPGADDPSYSAPAEEIDGERQELPE